MSGTRRKSAALVGLALAGVATGCQWLAGLEDRELSASGVAGGSAGAVGTSGAAGAAGTAGKAGGGGGAGASGKAGGAGAGAGGASANPCVAPPHDGGVEPPLPPGDAGATTGGTSLFVAARRFFLGTVVPDPDPTKSKPDFTAWRQLGYDVDGLCTSVNGGSVSMPACVPAGSATQDLVTDGDGCRDNAFGRFVSEKLGLLSPEKIVNDKIENGAQTFLLQIDDVHPSSCDARAPGRLYVAAATPSSPWQSATPRQVDGRSVCNDDLALPKMTFPDGYIVGDQWVSGPPGGELVTYFPLGAAVVRLHARSVVLTATLAPDHQSVISSTLSLVIDPKEMLEQFKPIALSLNACNDPGQIISAYIDSLLQYADLADTPGFVSPNSTCSLMSMGVGIAWTPVKPPSGVLVVPDEPPPCGGAGGASGAGGVGGASGATGASGASGAGGASGAAAGTAGSGANAGSGGKAGSAGSAGGATAGSGGAGKGGNAGEDCPASGGTSGAGQAGTAGAGKGGAGQGGAGTAGKGG